MRMFDAAKHASHMAESSRRVALAAALDESATTRTEGDAALVREGARACLWLIAGISRDASERFIDSLIRDHGADAVMHACIELCRDQPPGPKAWLQQACKQINTKEKP